MEKLENRYFLRSKSKENRPKNDIVDKNDKSVVDKSAKSDGKTEKSDKMKNGKADEKYVKLDLKKQNSGNLILSVTFLFWYFWLNGIGTNVLKK